MTEAVWLTGRVVAGVVLAAALSCLPASAQTPATQVQASSPALENLIKAAQAEGVVVLYTTSTPNVTDNLAKKFEAKYGVKITSLRVVDLQQRYSSEAGTGKIIADIGIQAGNLAAFGEEALKKGWIDRLPQAGVPAIDSGEFPSRFMNDTTAVIQISPWILAYHTEKVRGNDIPKDWPDILDPKFKGQIVLPDPGATFSYIDFWAVLVDLYGPSFFEKFRAQSARVYSSGVPAIQALAAGEGAIQIPVIESQVKNLQVKGAPLATVSPPKSTGVELRMFLTARDKAEHPNAARLLAHYVMSREGNAAMNSDPGTFSVYDHDHLPQGYQSPVPGTAARKDEIRALLGVK